MDVVDEDAFFQWKEDITQEYPGKGQALFQVGVRGSYRILSRGGGGGGEFQSFVLTRRVC